MEVQINGNQKETNPDSVEDRGATPPITDGILV